MLKPVSLDGALSSIVVVVVIDMNGCSMNGCCELPMRSDASGKINAKFSAIFLVHIQ